MSAHEDFEPKIFLIRSDLKAMGIDFCDTSLLRLEYLGRFPRRIRLSGNKIVWDRDEILKWIEDRKKDRDSTHYADPF